MKDFCLIADPLPYSLRVHPHRNICPDYRLFVQFEADMLRVKDDQEAAPRMASALDRFLGAGWQTEYTTQQAFDQLLWFYRGGQAAPDPSKAQGPRPPLAFDYIIDGPLIAAAFQSAYGIDLTDPRTRLHWWRFQALLQGLPDECRFCRVIGWRTADLSGLKGKQLAFYSDMKRKFALPADLGGEKQVYATKAEWDAAFIQRLKRQAGKK